MIICVSIHKFVHKNCFNKNFLSKNKTYCGSFNPITPTGEIGVIGT